MVHILRWCKTKLLTMHPTLNTANIQRELIFTSQDIVSPLLLLVDPKES